MTRVIAIAIEHTVRMHLHWQNYQDHPNRTDGIFHRGGGLTGFAILRTLQLAVMLGSAQFLTGQDLAPRAYVITPLRRKNDGPTYAIKVGEDTGTLVCPPRGVYIVLEFGSTNALRNVHIGKQIGGCF